MKVYETLGSLSYNGQAINFDAPVEMEEMHFNHMYFSKGFMNHMYFSKGFMSKKRGTHCCLKMGYWCWKNALERPQDILVYLKRKLWRK